MRTKKTVGNRKYIFANSSFFFFVNIILSKFFDESVIDIWDVLSVFILLIIVVTFIIGD